MALALLRRTLRRREVVQGWGGGIWDAASLPRFQHAVNENGRSDSNEGNEGNEGNETAENGDGEGENRARSSSGMPSTTLAAKKEETPVPGSTLSALEQTSLKAQLVFDASWKAMEDRFGGKYVSPREIVWLNGAPGSGKGTNVPFIMRSRGLSRSVGMSQLLDSPEIKSYVDRGELVPDAMVLDALLDSILNPEMNDGHGVVIDGFPRTATQVDFVKLLYDKLMERHLRFAEDPEADEWRSPRPSFKVVILYVDEAESVRRQMKRAELTSLHNERVKDAGTGDVWNVRATDVNQALCKRRYQVFKSHYNTILRLKSYFPFSLIDAMGSLQDCRAQINRELRYQSSLDLDEKTYASIRHLPLARDLVRVARQRLVFRLDMYCRRHFRLFTDIISLIDTEVMPVLKQCSMAGHAEYRSRHPLLLTSHLAVDMLIDILTDRGFNVAHFVEERLVPRQVDMKSGKILSETEDVHSFRITFNKENIRDMAVSGGGGGGSDNSMIVGKTFVPKHLLRGGNPEELTGVLYQHPEKHRGDGQDLDGGGGSRPGDTTSGGGGGRGGQAKAAAVSRMAPSPKGTKAPASKGYDMEACYDAQNERED